MNKFPVKYLNKFFSLTFIGIAILMGLSFLSGCSIRKIVVGQLQPIVDEMQTSILNEPEEIFVKGSLPFAIKFAESLYRYYPDSPYYSGKLAMLYAAYTFAYFDNSPYDDFDEDADAKTERLLRLYDKAYRFGLKSLDTRIDRFSQQLLEPAKVPDLLSQADRDDVEVLFWFNFSWAMKILHQLSDTVQLASLETVKMIADRIEELDSGYFYGINTAIFIAYYGGRVDALGGNKTKAKEYYLKNQEAYSEKSLIADFVYFRYVTTQNPSPEEFQLFYNRIKNFDTEKSPDFQFINTFLKNKAEDLYKKKSWLF